MKTIFLTLGICFLFAVSASAQTDPCPPMPEGYLCVPRAVAIQALEDSDARMALEAEKVQLTQAIEDLRKEVNNMRIEFARVSGENTALKQNAVSDRAIIDLLLKNTRKKCLPLSVCF
jgi:hypothetical protein